MSLRMTFTGSFTYASPLPLPPHSQHHRPLVRNRSSSGHTVGPRKFLLHGYRDYSSRQSLSSICATGMDQQKMPVAQLWGQSHDDIIFTICALELEVRCWFVKNCRIQLSARFTQTVSAVVIACSVGSRLRSERLIVASLDYFVDLTIRLLVIQVMNFFLAGTCICQVSFAIHVASVSSHAGSFLTQLGPLQVI